MDILPAEIAHWCNMTEQRERERTFARDDLAAGNDRARHTQKLMIEIVRLVRAAQAAKL